MSIASNAGAESAATEIRDFVRKKIEEHEDKPEVAAVLREIEKMAQGIIEAASAGWY